MSKFMKILILFFIAIILTPFGLNADISDVVNSSLDRAIESLNATIDHLDSLIQQNNTEELSNIRRQLERQKEQVERQKESIESQRQKFIEQFDNIDIMTQNALDQMESIRSDVIRRSDVPRLGIFTTDLTLNKSRELGFNTQNIDSGILITGTVAQSPARIARILPDDILIKIDDQEINNSNQIRSALAKFEEGDTVFIEIFRNNEIMQIPVVLIERTTPAQTSVTKKESRTKNYPDVGGSWFPIYFELDTSDVNIQIEEFGFKALRTDGVLFNGGGGRAHVGKGFYLGGMGAGYSIERSNKNTAGENETPVIRKYSYTSRFGGVTFDKSWMIGRKFFVTPGLMLGGGSHKLSLNQYNEKNRAWDDFAHFGNSLGFNENLQKKYMMIRPTLEMSYMILGWIGIRAEAGYLYGYSRTDGWVRNRKDNTFEIPNSPETTFEGLTFSIGPWFSF